MGPVRSICTGMHDESDIESVQSDPGATVTEPLKGAPPVRTVLSVQLKLQLTSPGNSPRRTVTSLCDAKAPAGPSSSSTTSNAGPDHRSLSCVLADGLRWESNAGRLPSAFIWLVNLRISTPINELVEWLRTANAPGSGYARDGRAQGSFHIH